MWGRLSTKGNRPEEVITPVPWAHRNRGFSDFEFELETLEQKEPTVLWFENMKEMLDWTVLSGRTSNH